MSSTIDSAARIVAALITRNGGTMDQVEDMLVEVHAMMKRIEDVVVQVDLEDDVVKGTVFYDGIISLVDGRKYKNLKTHLTHRNIKPDDYRKMYKLPADYPMVCKELSERRVEIATDTAFWDKSEENKVKTKVVKNANTAGKGIVGQA